LDYLQAAAAGPGRGSPTSPARRNALVTGDDARLEAGRPRHGHPRNSSSPLGRTWNLNAVHRRPTRASMTPIPTPSIRPGDSKKIRQQHIRGSQRDNRGVDSDETKHACRGLLV